MQTPALRTKAIVTRAVPYNESDMIITLVSVDYGKITATAKGCLKPKAKLRYSAEPLNFGDYVLSGKNGRYVVTECSQIESFATITADIEKYYAASLILDVLQKLSQEPQPEIFVHSLRAISQLAYGEDETDCVITDYLLTLLDLNGSKLDFRHCNVCSCDIEGVAYFKDADGIVCEHCKGIMGGIQIDRTSRAYLSGENRNIPHALRVKANLLLADFVNIMLGVRISTHYFTEQI